MSAITSIQWCDRTWNPIRGCSRVSPGCDACYAMKQARRFDYPGGPYEGLTRIGPRGVDWSGTVRLVESALTEPLRWRKPCRIFVNSMSDLFHESLSFEEIAEVFHVMYGEASASPSPQHTYQILTKRPRRMLAFFEWLRAYDGPDATIEALSVYLRLQGPHPRVWLGVSVEDQARADERIPLLLQTPAAVRFISAEPMLGPIELGELAIVGGGGVTIDALLNGPHLDWVIVGGESGPGARPCDVEWIRSVVTQCQAAEVPAFVKQLGSKPMDAGRNSGVALGVMLDEYNVRHQLKDRKGGDIEEFPTSLRVRQFPRSAVPA